jgi:hypothetical protein
LRTIDGRRHLIVDALKLVTDTSHSIVDAGYASIHTGHALINTGHALINTGHALINTGHTFIDPSHSIVDDKYIVRNSPDFAIDRVRDLQELSRGHLGLLLRQPVQSLQRILNIGLSHQFL